MEIEKHDKINLAFEKYTTPWCSFNKTKAVNELHEEILKEIDIIYEYVSTYYVDWEKDTIETILPKLEKDIRTIYPYLNNKSVRVLKNFFAYEWK